MDAVIPDLPSLSVMERYQGDGGGSVGDRVAPCPPRSPEPVVNHVGKAGFALGTAPSDVEGLES